MADGKEKMLGLIKSFVEQIEKGYELGKGIKLPNPSQVVFSGMGGSAIAGLLMIPFLENAIPTQVNRSYALPPHVRDDAWLILISYSGNTEETLAVFDEAHARKLNMFCITSGGELEKKARANNVQLIMLPPGIPPRASLGYQFFAILRVLVNHGLISGPDIAAITKAASDPSIENTARELAKKCEGAVPLIYAAEENAAVAYRWKTQFNENAKLHAFTHTLPELDHNEILGYTKRFAKFFTIFLQYSRDHERVRKRMEITQKLIEPSPSIIVKAKGESALEQFAYLMHLGDLTTYHLAVSIGVDPFPVPVIELLKKELRQ